MLDTLPAIKVAALEYIHTDQDDEEWPTVQSNFRCIAAEPERMLEMVEVLEAFQKLPSEEELAAIGKLVRDLAGYLKLAASDKPDPIRDDLLQHAQQLLGLTGL